MFKIEEALTFSDVLLKPRFSTVKSRNEVSTAVDLGGLVYKHPVIPANMASVVNLGMAREIIESGGLAILHRFMTINDQVAIVAELHSPAYLGVSLGVQDKDKYFAMRLYDVGARIFCIDIAHGDSSQCVEMIAHLKCNFPDAIIIAGNVATAGGAERLWSAGAHIVKAGIGAGATCSTRIETGNGVPQLHALMDIASVRKGRTLISDGGISSAGDIVKALCLSDMVMCGQLFAGCAEAPGTRVIRDGQYFKEYNGSSTHKDGYIEGVKSWVPIIGPFKQVLGKILDGVRSGCSYQGVSSVEELSKNFEFLRVSSAGLRESHPHNVILNT